MVIASGLPSGELSAVAHAASHVKEPPLFEVLWRRRGTVLAGMGIGLLGSAIYLATVKPSYTCQASLLVQPVAPSVVSEGGNTQQSENYLNTQCQIIGSTSIAALTLVQPGVAQLPSLQNVGDPLGYIRKNLTAEVGKKDDLITVSLESKSQSDGMQIVNAAVNSYIELNAKRNDAAADSDVAFLEKQRAEAVQQRTALLQQIAQLRPFALENGNNSGEDFDSQRRQTMADALRQSQLESVNASIAYDEAQQLIAGDPRKVKAVEERAGIADAADIEKLQSEVFRLQEQLHVLQRSYLPNHPVVREAQAELDQETIDYVVAARQRYVSSLKREVQLQNRYDQDMKAAQEQAKDAVTYAQLDGDQRRLQSQIDSWTATIANERHALHAQDMAITVNDWAQIEGGAHPGRGKTAGGGAAAGLVLGAVLALVREKTDKRVSGAAQVGQAAGVPVLGVIPTVPTVALAGRTLASYISETGEMASAVRSVLRVLDYVSPTDTTRNGPRCQSLLITSPGRGEGRTALTVSLGAAMARAGRRVAIIDADFRNPTIHKLFGLENRIGLSTLCNTGGPISRALTVTEVDNLDVMPSGPVLAGPADLLNSPTFAEILADLAQNYDHVLLDAPSVASGPDARIAAANCDGTVLVLNSTQESRVVIDQTRHALVSVGAQVLGVVINDGPVVAPAKSTQNVIGPDALAAVTPLRMSEGGTTFERGLQAQRV